VLSIFAPYAEGGYWRCDFSISGLGTKGIVQGRGQGLDSFDAVLSAMQIASIRIYTSELHKAGRLEWLEKGAGYGLPLLDSLADIAHPGLKPVSTLHVYI
jgi:hypothetical protein